VGTGKQHKQLPCPGDLLPGPTFSHDGAWLAVYGMDGLVTLWDARTFTVVRTLESQRSPPWDLPVRIRSAAFDTEGRILATGREDGKVLLWEVATGRKVAEFSVSSFPVLGLAFLPGNKRLAVFAPEQRPFYDFRSNRSYFHCFAQVLDIDEKSPTFKQPLYQWKAPDTDFLSFSVAGEHLCFMKDRYKAVPSLGVADAATGEAREIKSVPGIVPVTVLAVPGGGLLVGYSDKVARFWNTETARVEWEVPLPSGEDHGHFALHPDGKTVAFGADDLPRVHFFDLTTRQEIGAPR
jgi:WD40 repeat protein